MIQFCCYRNQCHSQILGRNWQHVQQPLHGHTVARHVWETGLTKAGWERWNFVSCHCVCCGVRCCWQPGWDGQNLGVSVLVGGAESQGETDRTLLGVSVCCGGRCWQPRWERTLLGVSVVVGGVDSQDETDRTLLGVSVVVGGVDSQGETDRTLLGVSVCCVGRCWQPGWDRQNFVRCQCLLWWEVLTARVRQTELC